MAGCEGDATALSRASIAGAALCGDGGDGGGSARCDESAAEDSAVRATAGGDEAVATARRDHVERSRGSAPAKRCMVWEGAKERVSSLVRCHEAMTQRRCEKGEQSRLCAHNTQVRGPGCRRGGTARVGRRGSERTADRRRFMCS
jgi:hypothetical protein